jgi:hypothetical protein
MASTVPVCLNPLDASRGEIALTSAVPREIGAFSARLIIQDPIVDGFPGMIVIGLGEVIANLG